MATSEPKQSRLRIKPAVYVKLETLAAADRRRPTDQAEVLIEQAFERLSRKADQAQPEGVQ